MANKELIEAILKLTEAVEESNEINRQRLDWEMLDPAYK